MLLRRLAPLLVIAVIGVLAGSERARAAEVIYDTFPFGADPIDAAPVGQLLSFDFQEAYPVDVTGDHSLDSITLSLWTDLDGNTQNGDWLLRFRADQGGVPGDVLEEWTLENNFFPGVTTVHKFVSVQRPLIFDGQRYWLHLSTVPGSGFAAWNGSLENTLDMLSSNQSGLNPPWTAPNDPYLLALMTVEAPEPAQALLLAGGAAILAGAARLRRTAPRASSPSA